MKKITLLLSLFCISLSFAQPGPNDGTAFNGIDQYILIPDSDNINTTPVDNRTIETYFKVNNTTNRQVFYKEGAEVNTIKFYVEDGYLYAGSYKLNGGPGESIWFRTPIVADTWYHVALVLENASTLKFYVNGMLQDSNPNYFQLPVHPGNFEIARTQGPARYPNCSTWASGGLPQATVPVEVCLDDVTGNDNTVLFFGGRIYGFRIWDVVRTDKEIMDNKDILITDTTQPPGDQLIAFLVGNTMDYVDDNGNRDTEDVVGNILNVSDLSQENLNIYIEDQILKVEAVNGKVPESLTLFGLDGKQVLQSKASKNLHVSDLSSGVYILNVILDNRIFNTKILINQ